jgi:hypothetical protein
MFPDQLFGQAFGVAHRGFLLFMVLLTVESYLEMLREVVLSELENSPLYDNTDIISQQDGTPPHYSSRVREFLNNSFLEWIEQCGTDDCPPPPKPCDLMPYDVSV